MNTKKLWASALLCLVFTILWLVLMIVSISKTGSISTIEQAIDSVINTGVVFKISYVNAVFVTITVTTFFVCLYYYCKPVNAEWSLIGFVFIPIYSLMNLFVYFSQITVIPRLITLMNTSENFDVYKIILGQFVQGWPGSAISVLNQLAYAVLGIPSIVFGMMMVKNKKVSTVGGWLLIFNGISCIIGAIGTAANNQLLAIGSIVGGALFLFSLIAIVFGVKRSEKIDVNKSI